jgi:hypothetical protein
MAEMIRFKEYIAESQPGVISAKDAQAKLSKRKWKTITTHKWFADYMHTAQTVNIPIGFKIGGNSAFDEVYVAHGPMGNDKLRRMLRFVFLKDKLINIDYYQNWHDELIGGHIKWKHIKSLKAVKEENTQGDIGTDKLTKTRKKMTPYEPMKTPDMFPGWIEDENVKKDK